MILFINYFWICALLIRNFISFFLVSILLCFKIINWSKTSLSRLLNRFVGQAKLSCKPSRVFKKCKSIRVFKKSYDLLIFTQQRRHGTANSSKCKFWVPYMNFFFFEGTYHIVLLICFSRGYIF